MSSSISQLSNSVQAMSNTMHSTHDVMAETLPNRIVQLILNNIAVNGAIPISREDFVREFSTLREQLRMEVTQASQSANVANDETENSSDSFRVWTWGGRIHPVPQDFRFPR